VAQYLAISHPGGPTPGDLPEYLGFGLLDQDSVRSENGWLTATYSDEYDVVYEVRWNANGCLLKSYWRGNEVGRAGGPDLRKAFFYSWLGADDKSWVDPRFVDLFNEIIRTGNVYVLFPRPEWVFYPSGLLFTLRQPIPEGSLPAWEAFKRTLEAEGARQPRLTLYQEAPGSVLHMLEGGDSWREPVLVADLVVPLARLPQAVRACVDGGIVPRGLHHRLLVLAGSGVAWQPGDQAQREREFAVITDEELAATQGRVPPPSALSAETHIREEGGNR